MPIGNLCHLIASIPLSVAAVEGTFFLSLKLIAGIEWNEGWDALCKHTQLARAGEGRIKETLVLVGLPSCGAGLV